MLLFAAPEGRAYFLGAKRWESGVPIDPRFKAPPALHALRCHEGEAEGEWDRSRHAERPRDVYVRAGS